MTKSKRVYVLVDDDQVPLSPSEVAEMVSLRGFTGAAEPYGYSEETLRAFLQRNGYRAQTTIVYEKPSQLSEEGQEALDTAVKVVAQLGG